MCGRKGGSDKRFLKSFQAIFQSQISNFFLSKHISAAETCVTEEKLLRGRKNCWERNRNAFGTFCKKIFSKSIDHELTDGWADWPDRRPARNQCLILMARAKSCLEQSNPSLALLLPSGCELKLGASKCNGPADPLRGSYS